MAKLTSFFSNVLKEELKQTGTRKSIPRDAGRSALPPGKRISKTGKIYWESRANRTDVSGTNL